MEANGADPAVVRAIAEDLDLPVKGEELSAPVAQNPRRVSWSRHLKRALRRMLVYGHAYFELVWEDASETEDGLTHLRKIAPRHSDARERHIRSRAVRIAHQALDRADDQSVYIFRREEVRLEHDPDGTATDWVPKIPKHLADKEWTAQKRADLNALDDMLLDDTHD